MRFVTIVRRFSFPVLWGGISKVGANSYFASPEGGVFLILRAAGEIRSY